MSPEWTELGTSVLCHGGFLMSAGSSSVGNGRPGLTKGQSLSSMPYVVDIVNLSEVPAYKNPNVLRQKYLEEGLTVNQMSVLLGCGPTTIKKQLRYFSIRKTEVQEIRHKANLKYGQKLIAGQVQEHKQEAHIKQAILDMYQNQGLSVTAIARLLTQMKVPTKKRGKGWDHSVVIDILTREGVYQPKRKGGKK